MSITRSTLAGRARRLTPSPAPRRLAALLAAVLGAAAALAAPGIAAAKPAPPALSFSPAPFDYGQVTVRQPASQTFTLANSGRQATGRLRVRVAGSAAFAVTGDTCKTLAPGKTCTVTVRFTPAHGGTVTATLTAAGKNLAAADALTGTGKGLGSAPGHLYWATGSTINEAGLDGSSPRTLVTGQEGAEGLAAGASHLYWTNTANATISEAGLDGSNPHVIVTGVLSHGVAVDASHLYWTAVGEGAVYEAGLDGSDPQPIITGQSDPYGVAVDPSHLYWTNPRAGTIWAAGLDGSSPHAIVTGQDFPTGVAAGGAQGGLLYWANTDNGTINQAGLDGSNPHAIIGGMNHPAGVADDSASVYWASPNAGTVLAAGLDSNSAYDLFPGRSQGAPYGVAVTPPPPPALAFTPAPFDYGQVGTAQPVSHTFTLANTGGQATGPLTDTLTGPAAFTVTGDTCTGTSLEVGGTCTVTVRFAPASITAFTATLTTASANQAATATDALTGTGVLRPRFLYWTNSPMTATGCGNGTVNQAGLDGTRPHAIVTGQACPTGVAASTSDLYWSTGAINLAGLDGSNPHAIVTTRYP